MQCYILNIEAVGFMVSEIFQSYSPLYGTSMEANDLQGSMVGMIYVGDHPTLLYKYTK